MHASLRPALAALLVFSVSGCGSVMERVPRFGQDRPASPAAVPAAAQAKAGVWAQDASDIAPDPAIRFGTLPNGMRYAVMKNATPPGQASLRLWFDAGSLQEEDDQQGLAHFLEHMAFNGSKNVPEGEMVKILERHGLAFGADTNASTGLDQTIYKLDLPTRDPATIDASLMLMRETASELTIDPAAVDRERGVILSEERARDTPAYRVYKARQAFLLKDQRPPLRMPIGQVQVIQTAPAERLADYYRKYYRPERAVLVMVGDFDPDAMETQIRERFADWTGNGPAGTDPDLGRVAPRDTEVKLHVEPGSQASAQISWIRPPDLAADTADKRRADLNRRLGLAVLNRRLATLARGDSPPFIAAGAFASQDVRAADLTTLFVTFRPDDWQGAMAAAEREARRAATFGVRQDELDREIAEAAATLNAAAATVATRRTPGLANAIVNTLSDREVFTSPVQDLALFQAAVKDLKAETVSAALKDLFKGSGPLVFATLPAEPEGGEAAVRAAFASSSAVAVTPPAAPSVGEWPYLSFGAPGKVVETRDVADLDAEFVRFENGVRLTVKPTRFRDDEVLVKVMIGDGLIELPADRQSLTWAGSAFIEGGLGKIAADDMERVLASKVYGANFTTDDDAFVLSGRTRTEDLPTQLQVLAAYASDPGYRAEAFTRMRTYGSTLHDQYEATASGVLGRDLPGLLRAGDRRWTFPRREEIGEADAARFRAEIGSLLAKGDIEVVIVGDITTEKATQAVAETFGALPARPAAPAATPGGVRFPAPVAQPVTLTHKGRADQAIGYIAWPTSDFFADPARARIVTVMGEVMDLRLSDEVREAQGTTYSPSVRYSSSFTWPGYGFLAASIEAPPEKMAGFFADAEKIAAALRDAPVSDDELQRAKAPKLEQLDKARNTNEYWLSELSGAQTDPRRLDALRSVRAGIERVTAADIQRVAREVLIPGKAWKLLVRPEK